MFEAPTIERWKARLVADGNTQRRDCGEFDQIFSTVVKLSTVRLLLVLACIDDHELSSVDVRQAYLYADVDEDLYMRVPPTLPRHDADGDEVVVKLNKSHYGLRQAARQWNRLLVSFLLEWGFAQSTIHTCLFVYNEANPHRVLRIAVWVDDIVISASDNALRGRFVAAAAARFALDDKGELHWILGVRVGRDRKARSLTLSQYLYVSNVLGKHATHVAVSRACDVPLSQDDKLSREQCPSPGSPEHVAMRDKHAVYMTVVGALLWLASFTRPDLTYAAAVLARFVSNPARAHFVAMQRVLAYLHTTRHLGLLFSPTEQDGLVVYSDADWATRFSTSGSVILFASCPVHWHTRLQRSVSHSTAEAEYIGASMAAREATFIRELLRDFGRTQQTATPMRLDSKSAIDMAFDPVAFKKTKHVLRDAEYLRDLVAREVFRPTHVPSAEQLFTKALMRAAFAALRPRLVGAVPS
jgi:hypothetical protein